MPGIKRIQPKRPIRLYLSQWGEFYGLNQSELAKRLGVHPLTLGRWERHDAGVNLNILQTIAEALHPTLRYDDLTRKPPKSPRRQDKRRGS